MRKDYKKRSIVWIALLVMLIGIWMPDVTAWASEGKTSIAVSAGSVDIGETVTVTARAVGPSKEKAVATMTLSYDSSMWEFVSCSTTYGGGGNSVTATGDSFTVTLKAIGAGDSSISLSGADGVVFDSNEELDSMEGSSTKIKVNNAVGSNQDTSGENSSKSTVQNASQENNSEKTDTSSEKESEKTETNSEKESEKTETNSETKVLSADNSLKTLSISDGTLSPAFTGKTTKYTVTVPNDVTKLAITAIPVNENAVVESVIGGNSLEVGQNTVSVVVKAENGVKATYTIQVTRETAEVSEKNETLSRSQEEKTQEEQEEQVEQVEEVMAENNTAEENNSAITIDGANYEISENFTAEQIPADFEEVTISYHGTDYKGVKFTKGSFGMLYLISQNDAADKGKFYIYDSVADNFLPYIKLTNAERYIIPIPRPAEIQEPAAYEQADVEIEGQGKLTAYAQTTDMYIFYAVNQEGFAAWYRYDSVEKNYQRLAQQEGVTEESTEQSEEIEYLQKEYSALSEAYEAQKSATTTRTAILIFIIAVLAIVIINLLMHRKNTETELYDEYEEEDDFENEQALLKTKTSVKPETEEREVFAKTGAGEQPEPEEGEVFAKTGAGEQPEPEGSSFTEKTEKSVGNKKSIFAGRKKQNTDFSASETKEDGSIRKETEEPYKAEKKSLKEETKKKKKKKSFFSDDLEDDFDDLEDDLKGWRNISSEETHVTTGEMKKEAVKEKKEAVREKRTEKKPTIVKTKTDDDLEILDLNDL